MRSFEGQLYQIQKVPSDLNVLLKGSFPFDLAWNYEQLDETKLRQPPADKRIIDRSLMVSFYFIFCLFLAVGPHNKV